ncbi:hypothetical protein FOZ62_015527, partial [Perkinsus olseni]
QLDRRIHEGLGDDLSAYSDTPEYGIDPTHFGVYRWAFDTVRIISSETSGKWEYWFSDKAGIKRGVELRWANKVSKYMIVSLSVISPYKVAIPDGYPVRYSALEELNNKSRTFLEGQTEYAALNQLLTF